MPRIYLDTNVWCRPFDVQTQKRIEGETEAFFKILGALDAGEIEIVGSVVLEDEVSRIEEIDKRDAVSELIYWSVSHKVADIPSVYKEISKLGLKIRDSAHIACAIRGGAEYFITVDDDILKRKDKIKGKYRIKMRTPPEFLKRG